MSGAPQPVLSVQPHGQAIVASVLCSQLNHDNTQQLQRELSAAVAAAPAANLVLDLANVTFVPSLALGQFVKLQKQFEQVGHKFVLANVRPNVLEVLEVTALHKYLTIYPTTEDALKQVGG